MGRPLEYRDFELRIIKDGDTANRFKVHAKGHLFAGEMRFEDATPQSYNPGQFWDDLDEKKGGYLGRLEQRRVSVEDMYELGRLLANMALPEGTVRDLFRTNLHLLKSHEALRLRLFIEPTWLSHLPWEYMYLSKEAGEGENVPGDFLALQRNVSIVRTESIREPRPNYLTLPVTRMVGVLPNVDEPRLRPLELDREKDTLNEIVANLYPLTGEKTLKAVDWARHPITVGVLKDLLKEDTHIFHYAGHATFDIDPEDGQMKGQLLLEKEKGGYDPYYGEQLMRLLAGARVYLVVLNACETGHRDSQRIWGGIAAGLVREQIPVVIANQFSIIDRNARILTEQFYDNLLSGYTIDEALCMSRDAMYDEGRSVNRRDWGVPVLYMRDQVETTLFPPQYRKEEDAIPNVV